MLLCVNVFFWQGLTGADGHQQRTDYLISTKAAPGRYDESISHSYLTRGCCGWRGIFLLKHMANQSVGMFCAQEVYNTIFGVSNAKTTLHPRWKEFCILKI